MAGGLRVNRIPHAAAASPCLLKPRIVGFGLKHLCGAAMRLVPPPLHGDLPCRSTVCPASRHAKPCRYLHIVLANLLSSTRSRLRQWRPASGRPDFGSKCPCGAAVRLTPPPLHGDLRCPSKAESYLRSYRSGKPDFGSRCPCGAAVRLTPPPLHGDLPCRSTVCPFFRPWQAVSPP